MNINVTLIGQMITFIIFVIFTMKYIWPNFQDILRQRKLKIEKGLKFSSLAKKNLEESLSKSASTIDNAKKQALTLIDNANLRAYNIISDAKNTAQIIKNKIILNANKDILYKKKEMHNEIKEEIISISIIIAEKLIMKKIDKQSNSSLINNIINKIG